MSVSVDDRLFHHVRPGPEPTRARYPDEEGFVERDGVRVFWERYGDGEPTLLLLPTWSVVPSRMWKAQIPYLARHFRVVTFDARGSGRSDRPRGAAAYSWRELLADALAVMNASQTERAVLVGASRGAQSQLVLAARHPERVAAAVFTAPFLQLRPWPPVDDLERTFDEASAARRALSVLWTLRKAPPMLLRSRAARLFARRVRLLEGASKFNSDYWRRDHRGFLAWIFTAVQAVEPHSTRQIESMIEWGLETDPQTLVDSWRGEVLSRTEAKQLCAAVRCPVLVVQGTRDIGTPIEWGEALAELTGGELIRLEGADHLLFGRRPVAFNLAVREFVEAVSGRAATARQAAAGTRVP